MAIEKVKEFFAQFGREADVLEFEVSSATVELAAIAVGVDARDGYVAINGWKELSAEKGVDFCRRLRDAGVQTVIYTDISRDGAEMGTNLELYQELSAIKGLKIIASGGISFESELLELERMGVWGAILGKALYTGKLDLPRAVQLVQKEVRA